MRLKITDKRNGPKEAREGCAIAQGCVFEGEIAGARRLFIRTFERIVLLDPADVNSWRASEVMVKDYRPVNAELVITDWPRPPPPRLGTAGDARSDDVSTTTTAQPTPPANAERLLKLREAVVNAPLEQFDMRRILCGTHSCAAGWYVRANPDCGLKFFQYDGGVSDCIIQADQDAPPRYGRDALPVHFGITNEESDELFFQWAADEPAAQKSEFLAKLDTFLAAHGINADLKE